MTKEQKKLYMRDYYHRNKEKIRNWARARYYTNPEWKERNRSRAMKWFDANKEKSRLASKTYYEKTKQLKGRPNGAGHHLWKEVGLSYVALHLWVSRQKGKPKKCEICLSSEKKKYEWANLDHKYRRNLDDYVRMCTSCHRKYDYKNGFSPTKRGVKR